MRRMFAMTSMLLLLVAASAAAEDLRGAWVGTAGDGMLQLRTSRADGMNGDVELPLAALRGLAETQVAALQSTPVQFTLVREAGTVRFEGSFKMREGAGHFVFTPNLAFLDTLRRLEAPVEEASRYWDSTPEQRLLRMALAGLTADYIRAMQAAGYRTDADTYTRMVRRGITVASATALRDALHAKIDAEALVRLRNHDITPEFIAEMRGAGIADGDAEAFIRLRNHGITAAYVRSMRAAGFGHLSAEELVYLRRHDVTPELAKAAIAAAKRPLSPYEVPRLTRFRERN